MAELDIQILIDKLKSAGVSERDIRIVTEATASGFAALQFDSTADPAEIEQRAEEITRLLKDNQGLLDGVVDVEEEMDKLRDDELRLLKRIIDSELKNGRTSSQRLDDAKKRYKLLSKKKKLREQERRGMEKGEQMAGQLLQSTLGINQEFSMLLKKGGLKGLLKGFTKSLLKGLHPVNLLVSSIQKMMESILNADALSAEFFKKTGMEENLFDVREAETQLKGFKVGITSDLFQAQNAMVANITDVTTATKAQNLELANVMTVLGSMGVKMDESSQMFVELTKSLGYNRKDAQQTIIDFAAAAQELGRPAADLTRDFNKAQPILARFGKMTEDIFLDTAAQATFLNMDVSKLISMGESMDTFEGAAKAAQSFNMALGQPFISAQALLAAETPAEKAAMIQRAFDQAGPEVRKRLMHSPRKLQALASEMQLDANELVRYLQGKTSKITGVAAEAKEATTTLDVLRNTVFRNQKVTDLLLAQIERIINNLIRATGADGVLGVIHGLAGVINTIVDTIDVFGLFGRTKDTKVKQQTAKVQKAQNIDSKAARKRAVMTGGTSSDASARIKQQARGDKTVGDHISDAFQFMASNSLGLIGLLDVGDPYENPTTIAEGTIDKKVKSFEEMYEIAYGEYHPFRKQMMAKYGGQHQGRTFWDLMGMGIMTRAERSKYQSMYNRYMVKGKGVLSGMGGSPNQPLVDYYWRNVFGDSDKEAFQRYQSGKPLGKKTYGKNVGLYTKDPSQLPFSEAFRANYIKGLYYNDRGPNKGRETNAETLFFEIMTKTGPGKNPSALAKQWKAENIVAEKKEDAYIQPVFNKKDKFYAAKDGGAIANALDEVLGAVDKLLEKSSDVDLDINERGLAQAVDEALTYAKRRLY